MNEPALIVIGAGAAGMMAAGTAALMGMSVTVIERNDRPGRKLMITGKGRCNVTNSCDVDGLMANIPVNGRFLYSAFSRFSPYDTMDFFENLGVKLKTERGNRVFPESDRAVDIVDALKSYCDNNGVKFIKARAKSLIVKDGAVTGVRCDSGEFFADKVIIATGGKSYPKTGSTGDGYTMAAKAGHNIIEPKPSLVPLTSDDKCCADMMGLSLKNVAISIINNRNGKIVYKDFGEMLFTHFGVSGPVILSASSHIRNMERGQYKLVIDLKPALANEQLDSRILRDFSENVNRDFGNSLGGLLPSKMIETVIKRSGIDRHKKVNQITREERKRLVELLKGFEVTLDGFRPIDEAIITSGGVDVSQIKPSTMESKLVQNLYFAGEVIDVDAHTGGFNLQIAFSTGYCAGMSASSDF